MQKMPKMIISTKRLLNFGYQYVFNNSIFKSNVHKILFVAHFITDPLIKEECIFRSNSDSIK